MNGNKQTKSNNSKTIALLAILLIALGALATTVWLNNQYKPVNIADAQAVEIEIPQNSSAQDIAVILKQSGLIRNEFFFVFYCRQAGLDAKLRAGLFWLAPSQGLAEIAETIAAGMVNNSKITVPEGFNNKQIGELLIQRGVCSTEEWHTAITSRSYDFVYLDQIPWSEYDPWEGFLFPDTYFIESYTTAPQIIQMMLDGFVQNWDADLQLKLQSRQLKLYDAVTIASLIEKEVKIGEERKTVAGVIYNRLDRGMLLQLCSSVLYALPEYKEEVTYQDLEIDSPYNTYKNFGLPPGPIANPGRASLEAALDPEEHQYLYFVAKGDGSHHFSTNYDDHLAATNKYSL